jgi:hypothetical protein
VLYSVVQDLSSSALAARAVQPGQQLIRNFPTLSPVTQLVAAQSQTSPHLVGPFSLARYSADNGRTKYCSFLLPSYFFIFRVYIYSIGFVTQLGMFLTFCAYICKYLNQGEYDGSGWSLTKQLNMFNKDVSLYNINIVKDMCTQNYVTLNNLAPGDTITTYCSGGTARARAAPSVITTYSSTDLW